jgi:Methane/Phenol/Alkene Hydroxylase
MTQATPKATPRSRVRGLKTWSRFGELGRRPTEYEVVTHNLNHTTGPVPLEMGPEVHGNVWLRTHRDAMKLTVSDWDAFRDPDSVTYASYVAGQDDQETYVEGLHEEFDGRGYDTSLSGEALDLLRRVLAPSRYFAHGLQMLSAYVQQLAPSSYVANCAVFQTADQLRRVQLTACRTKQLQLTYPDRDFTSGERQTWESVADWQSLRRAVELALVEFDWDRALVVTNLVVKPVGDLILLRQFARQAELTGARLDALIADNLWLDARRSQRWTTALMKFLIGANPGNEDVLRALAGEFAPLGLAMIDGGARLLAPSDAGHQSEIAGRIRAEWTALLEGAGLAAPAE